jgi:hypothetical protein
MYPGRVMDYKERRSHMSKGWREVARLGGTGARYPHVLVDPHGWCLRLGPNSRSDEKYYSSLPMLLHGLVEQSARRRLLSIPAALDLKELRREVEDVLHSALSLCHEVLNRGGLKEHIRRLETPLCSGTAPASSSRDSSRPRAGPAIRGLLSDPQAV